MKDAEIIYYIKYYNEKIAEILNTSQMRISIDFSKALRTAGTCRKITRNHAKITISRPLATISTKEEVQNTIIHELCHAYDTERASHGPSWKRIAKKVGDSLGFNITRTFTLSEHQEEKLLDIKDVRRPVGIIEVPEINYKRLVYRKGRGYKQQYKGWHVTIEGIKYPLVFTEYEQ